MKGQRFGALTVVLTFVVLIAGACREIDPESALTGPTSLAEVPAVRLNFRYEADVPPPEAAAAPAAEERNPAVQADFDQNRPQEVLDKTITSPDKKRVLAVYHRLGDLPSEFRLDMYTADGRLLRRVTPEALAVHFPDTIRWAPNSENVAFVGMARPAAPAPAEGQPAASPTPAEADAAATPEADANTQATPAPAATPEEPAGVLTFRTEQLYLADADGGGIKPITQNEGLIYFYYTWAPDSSGLAALAATSREWQYLNQQADLKGEVFTPVGRPRIIETNGRERRLDDGLTAVQPVWSPDSTKVAAAFDTQVRIYDAAAVSPTQAAVPLRNYLLLSSQAYDREQAAKLGAEPQPEADANTNANANVNSPAVPQSQATLPDERSLVSFNPIVQLSWPSDDLLYLRTAYVRRMRNETDSANSFSRWHRIVLSPQPMQGK